ncbi:MAG: 2-oxo-4-hydroxy-4-carboxy-5-ureidoimidazoline decarboxylase [Aestuariivirga sp.]|jgi:2-oxo-4-hydroxy-4-carboxy-5-ureidoimidazoline decarboxylase
MKLSAVNAMSAADFLAEFGGIAEHSAWVAEAAIPERPYANLPAMTLAFQNAVLGASKTAQLALLNAHPDLATKAKLTQDSTSEQKGAGLDQLTKAEFEYFTTLNNTYKLKNNFPFIFAVKGATKAQILAGFEQRIANDTKTEFKTALNQVCKIISFRLEAKVEE